MSFLHAFRTVLAEILENKKKKALSIEAHVPGATISEMSNGGNPTLENVAKVIDTFNHLELARMIKLTAPKAPIEVVNIEGMHTVHVYDMDGIDSLDGLKSQSPVFTLRIPETFFPSDYGVLMSGHSMEPLYSDKCAVGIREVKPNTKIVIGEDYLCILPYEGMVIRRVLVAPEKGGLEFCPLNEDKYHFRPQTFAAEEAAKKIIGRVKWISRRV